MAKKADTGWLQIAFDTWSLGVEASQVVVLRSARIAAGGTAGCAEARLMVTEKLESNALLCGALLGGQMGTTPQAMLGGAVRHYLKGVRANRKRLARRK